MAAEKRDKGLLIVGCGHGGTRYAARVLRALGLDVGHERPGADGRSDWHYASRTEGFAPVLHQTREPLATISACTMFKPASWRKIARRVPSIAIDDPLLLRCMKYYVEWNLLCGDQIAWRYRVEHLLDSLGALCYLVGVPYDHTARDAAAAVRRNVGHRKHVLYTWDRLHEADASLCRRVQDLREFYGYLTKGKGQDDEGIGNLGSA